MIGSLRLMFYERDRKNLSQFGSWMQIKFHFCQKHDLVFTLNTPPLNLLF